MDESRLAFRKVGFAHASATDPASRLKKHSRSSGVAVGSFVVRGQLMDEREDKHDSKRHQRNHNEYVHHGDRHPRIVREHDVANDKQNGEQHHGDELRPLQDRQKLQQWPVQLGAHLPAVVMRDKDHLAAARAACFGRKAGLVLGDYILAHAARERL